MGCHETHEEAEKQLQAILINEAKQKEEENSLDQDTELRQVDRTPPKFMQENAQRGLDNLNKAGDGLVDETVRQARIMAKGEQLSIDKIIKIAAWHKRHLSDLNEMSFAFAAIKDNFDQNGENREVNEARLFDVSVVT